MQIDNSEGVDFKSDNSLFKFVAQKYKNKAFWFKNTQIRHFRSQIEAFLFFREILKIGKFEGANLKSGNSFFKILAQNYPNKVFLVPNFGVFVFLQNFAIRQIRGSLFQIREYNLQSKNTKIKHFWSQI